MSALNGASSTQAFQTPTSDAMSPVEEKHNPATTLPNLRYIQNEPAPHSVISKRLRYMFFLRLGAFVVIEAAFIALAAVCLDRPIPLNISLDFSDSEVRGGFTVIFILWQTLAIIAGGHILADAFSREWSVQLAQLVPGQTDRVSTVTAGFVDRIVYFFTKRASGTFKLAFLASLSFMALTQLGPGSINAATTLINTPITLQIADIGAQIATAEDALAFLTTGSRASVITRLEQLERSTFGLRVQSNRFVAWPSVTLGDFTGSIEYESDVVEFNHDCHWEAPEFLNDSSIGVVVRAAGQAWSTADIVFGGGNPGSIITPLALTDLPIIQNTSLSAFLFVGGNITFRNSRVSPPDFFAIDLGSRPATFVAAGVGVPFGPPGTLPVVGPLASVLICNPNPHISGGRVRLSSDGSLSVVTSGQPIIGNMPPSAINIILSNALSPAIQNLDIFEITNIINDIGALLFMRNSSVDWDVASNVPPLDIPDINRQMDRFVLSASKAFSDGYRQDGTSATATFLTHEIPAIGQRQALALTTSKGLFIAVIVVVVIAILSLFALCRLALTQARYPFDLSSVLQVLQDEARRERMTPV